MDFGIVSSSIVLVAIAAFTIFLLPKRLSFQIALGFLVTWLALGNQQNLPVGGDFVKATGALAILFVIVTALLVPGKKAKPTSFFWLYLAVAAVSPLYVLYAMDAWHGVQVRVQWLLLVVAAGATVATIDDRKSLVQVFVALGVGYAIFVGIMSMSVLLVGAEVARGRLLLFGINPNQALTVAIAGAPFLIYMALRQGGRRSWFYWSAVILLLGAAAISSRQAFLGALVAAFIIFLFSTRALRTGMFGRGVLLMGVTIAVVGLLRFGDALTAETLDFSRPFEGGLNDRLMYVTGPYLNVISERFWFGILGESGVYVRSDPSIGDASNHPHNAYIDWWYLGGASLGVPILLLVLASTVSAIRLLVWGRTRGLGKCPLETALMVGVLLAIYIVGLVSGRIYYPTFDIAFVHILISLLVLKALSRRYAYKVGLVNSNSFVDARSIGCRLAPESPPYSSSGLPTVVSPLQRDVLAKVTTKMKPIPRSRR